jgi:hypothetical protein
LTSLGITVPLGQGLFINQRMTDVRKAKVQLQLSSRKKTTSDCYMMPQLILIGRRKSTVLKLIIKMPKFVLTELNLNKKAT